MPEKASFAGPPIGLRTKVSAKQSMAGTAEPPSRKALPDSSDECRFGTTKHSPRRMVQQRSRVWLLSALIMTALVSLACRGGAVAVANATDGAAPALSPVPSADHNMPAPS